MRKALNYLFAALLAAGLALPSLAEVEKPMEVGRFLAEAKVSGGPSAVIGVVSAVKPAEKRFAMVDAKKFGCCDKPENCVSGALPVLWEGPMPLEKALVRARGKVVEEAGRLYFKADDVKVLESPQK